MSEKAEALATLRQLIAARDGLAERLAEMLTRAQGCRWEIADEDWLAIGAVTGKLEAVNKQIEAARAFGLDSGPAAKIQ
jgi:hypothetical protein